MSSDPGSRPDDKLDALWSALEDDESGIPLWTKSESVNADLHEKSLPELKANLLSTDHMIKTLTDQTTDFSDPRARNLMGMLFARRNLALARIAVLSQRTQVQEFKAAVDEKVEDSAVRQELTDKLTEISARRTEPLAEQERAALRQLEGYEARKRLDLEQKKHTWALRLALLERDPAAVLIGGLLLVALTAALITGMFTHTGVPEIVSSAFLLILGFFFGQSNNRGGKPPSE
ncbi:hypothetical protein ACFQZZ_33190 [Nocardia sp. GCM10030253]|uniref:hypothetical protein n=1 Tax=Nocardia sp. GCM10030253 TaxID=3273404 RepID=UPI0036339B6B